MAVSNLQPQHQCRRAPFSAQPLQPLSFLRLFDKGCSDLYELIPPCTFLSYISVHFTMLKAFHVIFLKTMWVKLIFWDGPCGHWPCSESSPSPPRASAEDGCVFLQPSVLEPVKCQSAVFPLLLPKEATWGQLITLCCFVLWAKLIFIFSWSRVDFRCCACFRFTGTWFNYIETCISSFSGLSQIGSFSVFGRLLRVIQEVLLDYLPDNTL